MLWWRVCSCAGDIFRAQCLQRLWHFTDLWTDRQTERAGGTEGWGIDRDRAGTACSVGVSSTKASLYWPYIGAAVRVLGTPGCDCITAPEHTPLPHAKAAPSHTVQIFWPPFFYLTVPPETLLTRHQQHRPSKPYAETASLREKSIVLINQAAVVIEELDICWTFSS